MEWPLQDAKNQFSKVVQKARLEGPQVVTLRGERAAVVLSAADYDALRSGRPTLVDDLLAGPSWDDELAEAVTRRVYDWLRAMTATETTIVLVEENPVHALQVCHRAVRMYKGLLETAESAGDPPIPPAVSAEPA